MVKCWSEDLNQGCLALALLSLLSASLLDIHVLTAYEAQLRESASSSRRHMHALLCFHLAELSTTQGTPRLNAADRQKVLECSGKILVGSGTGPLTSHTSAVPLWVMATASTRRALSLQRPLQPSAPPIEHDN